LVLVALTFFHEITSVDLKADEKEITGKVTYTGSNKIAPGSKMVIKLQDKSLQDKSAHTVAMTTIADVKTFPISYSFNYKPSDISSGRTYTISAQILGVDDNLQFINDVQTPAILTGSTPPVIDIAVIHTSGDQLTPVKSNVGNKTCAPVKCRDNKPKKCAYGYQKNKNGCEICKCDDPCNPRGKAKLCGSEQRCFVEKKDNGTSFVARCVTPRLPHNKNVSSAVCKESLVVGICRGALPRFHHNSTTKMCEEFTYSGCGGNGNNFKSKNECEKICKT